MDRYPLRIPEGMEDKELCVTLGTIYRWCNVSFYNGFLSAVVDTPEALASLSKADRMELMYAAEVRSDMLCRPGGDKPHGGA